MPVRGFGLSTALQEAFSARIPASSGNDFHDGILSTSTGPRAPNNGEKMGTARRWKRKQSRDVGEYPSSIGVSHYYERGKVEVVVDNDLDGTAVAWQCRFCEAYGSALLPVGIGPEALAEHEFFKGFLQEHEGCEQQPEAKLPAEVAEAFDALRNGFETGLQKGGQRDPIALLLGTKIVTACPPFQDDAGKQRSFSLFRTRCRSLLAGHTDAPGVAIGLVGWTNSNLGIRPSHDPARSECVILYAVTDTGTFFRHYAIERKCGKPGSGPGRLNEISKQPGVTCLAWAFLTCAARPVLVVGDDKLVS